MALVVPETAYNTSRPIAVTLPASPPDVCVSSKDFDKIVKRLKALEKPQKPNA